MAVIARDGDSPELLSGDERSRAFLLTGDG